MCARGPMSFQQAYVGLMGKQLPNAAHKIALCPSLPSMTKIMAKTAKNVTQKISGNFRPSPGFSGFSRPVSARVSRCSQSTLGPVYLLRLPADFRGIAFFAAGAADFLREPSVLISVRSASAFSSKGPVEPMGRRTTMPAFRMAA